MEWTFDASFLKWKSAFFAFGYYLPQLKMLLKSFYFLTKYTKCLGLFRDVPLFFEKS